MRTKKVKQKIQAPRGKIWNYKITEKINRKKEYYEIITEQAWEQ